MTNSLFFFPKEERTREILNLLYQAKIEIAEVKAEYQALKFRQSCYENLHQSRDIERERLQSMMQTQVNNSEIERLRAEMQVQKFDYSQIVQNARLVNVIGRYHTSSFTPQNQYYFADDRIYVVKGSDDTIEETKSNGTPPEKIEINSDGYAILDPVDEIEDKEPSQKPSLLDRLLKKGRRV